jgi:hypothetical protein
MLQTAEIRRVGDLVEVRIGSIRLQCVRTTVTASGDIVHETLLQIRRLPDAGNPPAEGDIGYELPAWATHHVHREIEALS